MLQKEMLCEKCHDRRRQSTTILSTTHFEVSFPWICGVGLSFLKDESRARFKHENT
jgi:hypothetical protein